MVVIGYVCCVGVMVGSVVAVALAWYLADVTKNDETNLTLTNLQLSLTTIIYCQDPVTGEYQEYQRLGGDENRIWVDLEDIPDHVKNAFIAVEDKNFYKHHGVDFFRTFAAMINEYTPIKIFNSKTGASTITQQLVKNLTNDNEGEGLGGAFRKIREIFRAYILEKQYSKDEILEAYLNTLRLSNNWAGVQAGANNYFGKDVKDLTIAEAASLAGITKNPSVYNPYTHPENNIERRDDILFFMNEQGYITDEEYNSALQEELVLNDNYVETSRENSYFTDMVIDWVVKDLMEQYDLTREEATDRIYNDGLKIYSTVNPKLQSAMEKVMLNEDGRYPTPEANSTKKDENGDYIKQTPQAAMVTVDYNGGIAGVVGGLGEKEGDRVLNRAVDSVRQTGSTMKPIGAYALALEYHYINFSYTLYDDYVEERKDEATGQMKPWPRNYSGTYSNTQITVRQGIAKSLNTIAVRTLRLLTPQASYDFLTNSLHITSLDPVKDVDYSPLALGGMTTGISPLEMAAAYAIFGNSGKYIKPYCYTTVEDSTGEIILETKVTSVQAISEQTAYIMNRLLKGSLAAGGTASGLACRRMDSVGKTGTTSDDKDHWFMGLTPYYCTASWYGYDDPVPLTVRFNSHPPTTAWRDVMDEAQRDLPAKDFAVPRGVISRSYCAETGNIANANCPNQLTGYYTEDNMPPVCQTH